MKVIKLLCVTATICAVSNTAMADNGESDTRVRTALSEKQVMGQVQPVAQDTQAYVETGMSVAAGRMQHSLNQAQRQAPASEWAVEGDDHAADFVNDAGQSIPATHIEHALSESA